MKKDDFVYEKYVEESLRFSEVYKYLDKYVNEKIYLYTDEKKRTDVKENKTIWILWMQGEKNAPRLIQRCIESVRNHKPTDSSVIVLDANNLEEFINLPEYITQKYREGKISKTHFSDLVRLELLAKYGGCWVDASVFCSKKIPKVITDGELFFFKSSFMDHPMYKGSSWWIYAKAGNRLICGARNALFNYWKHEDELRDYYLIHIVIAKLIDNDLECRRLYNEMPTIGNMQPHVLWEKLDKEYNRDEWKWIADSSYVHKLSYKRHIVMGDTYNFYNALLDGLLSE